MFTKQESDALLTFMSRVSLNGNEAETLVYLKNKIKSLTEKPKEVKEEPQKKP